MSLTLKYGKSSVLNSYLVRRSSMYGTGALDSRAHRAMNSNRQKGTSTEFKMDTLEVSFI